MTKLKRYSLYTAVFLTSFAITRAVVTSNPTDLTKNAVMIVNKAMNHGGTGVIYESSPKGTRILTNRHVCRAIENGGVVKATTGQYQVQSILESQVSDLCMVFVPGNLKEQTKLADFEPQTFSLAKVSGHPALMPTVISTGHFSERQIIQVFTGMRLCTDAEKEDPDTQLICYFFNGFPVIKSYESVLVTATIMPGSSGSGVYNDNNELSGVVFAGQGDFGYAWTVPYDQVSAFLKTESQGKFTDIDQTISLQNNQNEAKDLRELFKKCSVATDPVIVKDCQVLFRDQTWVK